MSKLTLPPSDSDGFLIKPTDVPWDAERFSLVCTFIEDNQLINEIGVFGRAVKDLLEIWHSMLSWLS